MSAEPSDVALVVRVQRDPVALELLYRRHVGRVMSFAARRCSEPQDVADLVAATFVAVLESAGAYDPSRGEVLPWILGIERNLLAERGRRNSRERELLARTLGQRLLDHDEYAQLEERIDAARAADAASETLEMLGPEQREALLLVGYDGLSSRQAATALGITPTAFRMRLSRARRALRKAIADTTKTVALAPTTTDARDR